LWNKDERGFGISSRTLLLSLALALVPCLWVLYVVLRVVTVGQSDDLRSADAIVVLGTEEYRGWPSPRFSARLDHALSLYEEGVAPLVVVAGGDPEGDSYTEADAGESYLEYYGLPSDALLTVGGDNTYQNLQEMKALAEQEGLENVVLVSERFHMFRSLVIADDLGLRAYGSPTSTSPREHNPTLLLYSVLREVAAYTAYVLGLRSSTPL
jgi:uncharacterized SAM-binding protein YcdF (DUF218 family)